MITFSKPVMPNDHELCKGLLAQVHDRSASWPNRWASAKKANNKALMKRLLDEAEVLSGLEKALKIVEINMRAALLQREAVVARAMDNHFKKQEQSRLSFKQRLTLKGQQAVLRDNREQLNRSTVKMGLDYLHLMLSELIPGGIAGKVGAR